MDNPHSFQPHNPLIVQSDHTLLLEVHNPLYEPARTAIGAFAELEKSPEHIHTYHITPLSLRNTRCRRTSRWMCAIWPDGGDVCDSCARIEDWY